MLPVFNTMETRGKVAVQQDTMDLASLIFTGKDMLGAAEMPPDLSHVGLFMNRKTAFQHLEKEGISCVEYLS